MPGVELFAKMYAAHRLNTVREVRVAPTYDRPARQSAVKAWHVECIQDITRPLTTFLGPGSPTT